jgi:hypothetical protein
MMTPIAPVCFANKRPNSATPTAAPTICHLRSKRSAK